MKLIGYIRVSTTGQLDGEGPGVQRDAIEASCKANGHRLVGWHEEPITGSSALEEREVLPLALADVEDGRAEGVIVYRLDRLARDLVQQELLLGEIRRVGGELFSSSEVENSYITDDGDPTRVLVRQLLGALAQWEKSMIRLRLKAGRAKKASRGGFAYGSPPFGQRSVKGELVPDESEQRTKERILELREAGWSYRQIAANLNAEGRTPKRAASWSAMGVRNVCVRALGTKASTTA